MFAREGTLMTRPFDAAIASNFPVKRCRLPRRLSITGSTDAGSSMFLITERWSIERPQGERAIAMDRWYRGKRADRLASHPLHTR